MDLKNNSRQYKIINHQQSYQMIRNRLEQNIARSSDGWNTRDDDEENREDGDERIHVLDDVRVEVGVDEVNHQGGRHQGKYTFC